MFSKNTPVVTFVILNGTTVVRKFRATKADLPKHFPMKDGAVIFGSRTRRELTLKELQAAKGLTEGQAAFLRRTNYLETLVPVVA